MVIPTPSTAYVYKFIDYKNVNNVYTLNVWIKASFTLSSDLFAIAYSQETFKIQSILRFEPMVNVIHCSSSPTTNYIKASRNNGNVSNNSYINISNIYPLKHPQRLERHDQYRNTREIGF